MTKNLRKIIQLKFILFFFEKTSNLQEKPSALKREHPALEKINQNFLCHILVYNILFCPWVISLSSWICIQIQIANPDPVIDPGTPLNRDPVTDPDLQH
jgi:hypothetical protein